MHRVLPPAAARRGRRPASRRASRPRPGRGQRRPRRGSPRASGRRGRSTRPPQPIEASGAVGRCSTGEGGGTCNKTWPVGVRDWHPLDSAPSRNRGDPQPLSPTWARTPRAQARRVGASGSSRREEAGRDCRRPCGIECRRRGPAPATAGYPGVAWPGGAARRRLPRGAAGSRRLHRRGRVLRHLRLRDHDLAAHGPDRHGPDRSAAFLRPQDQAPRPGPRRDGCDDRCARHGREPGDHAAGRSDHGHVCVAVLGQRVSLRAPHRLLRPCGDAQSVPAPVDARGRGAVLPLLPGAPAGGLVGRTPAASRRSLVCGGRGLPHKRRLVPPRRSSFSGSGSQTHQQLAFFGSPTRAWEFGAGALLALLVPWLARIPRPVAQTLGVAGLAAIGVAAFSIHDPGGFPVMATLLPVVVPALCWRRERRRVVAGLPVCWAYARWSGSAISPTAGISGTGRSSSSPPCCGPARGGRLPTLAALSLLPAWLSYRYVENPIRFSPRIAGRTVLVLGAVCVAVPLAACLGLRRNEQCAGRNSDDDVVPAQPGPASRHPGRMLVHAARKPGERSLHLGRARAAGERCPDRRLDRRSVQRARAPRGQTRRVRGQDRNDRPLPVRRSQRAPRGAASRDG